MRSALPVSQREPLLSGGIRGSGRGQTQESFRQGDKVGGDTIPSRDVTAPSQAKEFSGMHLIHQLPIGLLFLPLCPPFQVLFILDHSHQEVLLAASPSLPQYMTFHAACTASSPETKRIMALPLSKGETDKDASLSSYLHDL